MQMMGEFISDPNEIECRGSVRGLSLLPITTTMRSSKVTIAAAGRLVAGALFGQPIGDIALRGYEIHVGETSRLGQAPPFARLVRKSIDRAETVTDGCVNPDSRIFGTYLHGLFDGDVFRHAFIEAARSFCHLAPAVRLNHWESKRRESLDRLAAVVSESLDMQKIFEWVGIRYQSQPARETSEAAR
jgi:adenosylcobyric acid synthase